MIIDLELKLEGRISVTIEELFELVSSWGRLHNYTFFKIKKCDANECYDLSNLDVSKIKDFSCLFYSSFYNGDLSKWNVSKCTNMRLMFAFSKFNNDSLKDWNISNKKEMFGMFEDSLFDGDISSWNIYNQEILPNHYFEKFLDLKIFKINNRYYFTYFLNNEFKNIINENKDKFFNLFSFYDHSNINSNLDDKNYYNNIVEKIYYINFYDYFDNEFLISLFDNEFKNSLSNHKKSQDFQNYCKNKNFDTTTNHIINYFLNYFLYYYINNDNLYKKYKFIIKNNLLYKR